MQFVEMPNTVYITILDLLIQK